MKSTIVYPFQFRLNFRFPMSASLNFCFYFSAKPQKKRNKIPLSFVRKVIHACLFATMSVRFSAQFSALISVSSLTALLLFSVLKLAINVSCFFSTELYTITSIYAKQTFVYTTISWIDWRRFVSFYSFSKIVKKDYKSSKGLLIC
jgi:hypothetical protein